MRIPKLIITGTIVALLLAACGTGLVVTPAPALRSEPTVPPLPTTVTATQPPGTPSPPAQLPDEAQTYPNAYLLVDVGWVAERHQDAGVRVVDMREPQQYAQAHIPGAVNIPVGRIVAAVDGVPFEFDEALVQQALNAAGLLPDQTVVIYDDLGMMNSARLFWTLEYVGHRDVRILDGGWNAWVAAGQPVSAEASEVEATSYPLELDPEKLVTAQQVLERLGEPGVVILDARSPQEYSGEARLAARGGHIPGAVHLAWLDVLEGGDAVYTIQPDWAEQLRDEDVEVFRPAAEISRLLEERGITPDKEVITYCQTLWRGAHAYFMLRLMGFENVRGYDGSWAEWGNDPDLPVVTGNRP